jgi:hypothetical protein
MNIDSDEMAFMLKSYDKNCASFCKRERETNELLYRKQELWGGVVRVPKLIYHDADEFVNAFEDLGEHVTSLKSHLLSDSLEGSCEGHEGGSSVDIITPLWSDLTVGKLSTELYAFLSNVHSLKEEPSSCSELDPLHGTSDGDGVTEMGLSLHIKPQSIAIDVLKKEVFITDLELAGRNTFTAELDSLRSGSTGSYNLKLISSFQKAWDNAYGHMGSC